MTKMTDERLMELLYSITHTWSAKAAEEIRAHIAALTAERDDMQAEAHGAVSGLLALAELLTDDEKEPALDAARRVVAERDALRERVKALKGECDRETRRANTWKERAHEATSRLAAIRQRAGAQGILEQQAWDAAYSPNLTESLAEKTPRMVAAVARYIAGEGATVPGSTCGNCADVQPATCAAHQPVSELDGLRGEMAEMPVDAAWEGPCEARRPSQEEQADAPESVPTTAEAFATVRAMVTGVPRDTQPSTEEGESALSLLERRMGAVERAAREACAQGGHGSLSALRAALTDASPVFTLDEVKTALVAELESPSNSGISYVDCCASACEGLMRRLTALRK